MFLFIPKVSTAAEIRFETELTMSFLVTLSGSLPTADEWPRICLGAQQETANVKMKLSRLESRFDAFEKKVGGVDSLNSQFDILRLGHEAILSALDRKVDKAASPSSGVVAHVPLIILNLPVDDRITESTKVCCSALWFLYSR